MLKFSKILGCAALGAAAGALFYQWKSRQGTGCTEEVQEDPTGDEQPSATRK